MSINEESPATEGLRSKYNNVIKPLYMASLSHGAQYIPEQLIASVSGSSTASIFIKKAYTIVEACNDNIVQWTDNGTAFVVHDPDYFAAQVLPLFFKHSKFASFVRQLNSHGFHKLRDFNIIAPIETPSSVPSVSHYSSASAPQPQEADNWSLGQQGLIAWPSRKAKIPRIKASDDVSSSGSNSISQGTLSDRLTVAGRRGSELTVDNVIAHNQKLSPPLPSGQLMQSVANRPCKFRHDHFCQGKLDSLQYVSKTSNRPSDHISGRASNASNESSGNKTTTVVKPNEFKRLQQELSKVHDELRMLDIEKSELKEKLQGQTPKDDTADGNVARRNSRSDDGRSIIDTSNMAQISANNHDRLVSAPNSYVMKVMAGQTHDTPRGSLNPTSGFAKSGEVMAMAAKYEERNNVAMLPLAFTTPSNHSADEKRRQDSTVENAKAHVNYSPSKSEREQEWLDTMRFHMVDSSQLNDVLAQSRYSSLSSATVQAEDGKLSPLSDKQPAAQVDRSPNAAQSSERLYDTTIEKLCAALDDVPADQQERIVNEFYKLCSDVSNAEVARELPNATLRQTTRSNESQIVNSVDQNNVTQSRETNTTLPQHDQQASGTDLDPSLSMQSSSSLSPSIYMLPYNQKDGRKSDRSQQR